MNSRPAWEKVIKTLSPKQNTNKRADVCGSTGTALAQNV
jgi:hypothetical protein